MTKKTTRNELSSSTDYSKDGSTRCAYASFGYTNNDLLDGTLHIFLMDEEMKAKCGIEGLVALYHSLGDLIEELEKE